MTRLVVDASVVVTAICSRWRRRGGGTRPPSSAIVLRMVHLGLAESLVSDEIEAEWRRVVEYDYPRKMAPARQRRAVVEALVRASRRVSPATMAGAVPGDPSDEIYVAAAGAGGATHLLTWDEGHLTPLDGKWGFRILTPAAFVTGLRAGRSGS
ncbi:MAG: PIN domain-containing protein [Anaeromyxobacteraceae bacterium]